MLHGIVKLDNKHTCTISFEIKKIENVVFVGVLLSVLVTKKMFSFAHVFIYSFYSPGNIFAGNEEKKQRRIIRAKQPILITIYILCMNHGAILYGR